MYIKQWERRYRQLEGIDDCSRRKSYMLEQYEDWFHTARSILDLDVAYMNSKEYNKFNLENYDPIYQFETDDMLLNMDDSYDNYDFECENGFLQFETIALDPSIDFNKDIISTLKGNNIMFRNGKLDNPTKKEKGSDREKSKEKQSKKSQKNNSQQSSELHKSVKDGNKNNVSPSKSIPKSPRKSQIVKSQRTRIPSTRRQWYICEFPGCSYQSDRNFNFLRHKRTHGKQKNEDTNCNKRIHNGLASPFQLNNVCNNLIESNQDFIGTEMNSINDLEHLSSPSDIMCQSDVSSIGTNDILNDANRITSSAIPINHTEAEQTFSLATDDFLDRNEINNLGHVLCENHFPNLGMEQTITF
ncbi:hypothetical protein RDWZM_000704 [Blomia tropicalis]|uniref:C2H2-type domain-containing protein n=1 Tax=Blomia tropicalis TaxID=40697 RepID=A0A9Q0RPU9_BLOTA|nr:hypothetical protein RDWZM_000704 [Blomia tropicalis]